VTLSKKQIAICKQVVQGKSDKEIASSFGISVDGVRCHLRVLFRKASVRSRTDLAMWFLFLSEDAAQRRLNLAKRLHLQKGVSTRRSARAL
jgi:DNA-binding CsgD family transcriptional regulator